MSEYSPHGRITEQDLNDGAKCGGVAKNSSPRIFSKIPRWLIELLKYVSLVRSFY